MDYTVHDVCSKIYNLIDDLAYTELPEDVFDTVQEQLRQAINTLTPYDEGETD